MIDGHPSTSTRTESSNISDICPGAEYFTNSTKSPFLLVNKSSCQHDWSHLFPAHQGVAYGLCGDSTPYCMMHIKVGRDMYIRAHVRRLAYWCYFPYWKTALSLNSHSWVNTCVESCHPSMEDIFVHSHTSEIWIQNINRPKVATDIQTSKRINVITKHAPRYSEVIVPYTFPRICFREALNFSMHIIMVSVHQSCDTLRCSKDNEMAVCFHKGELRLFRFSCSKFFCLQRSEPASTFLAKRHIQISFMNSDIPCIYKIHFAAFLENEHPSKLLSGLFNCSVNHYSVFQQFLHCNLKTECEDGRDETEHCSFSGPGCQGMVASRNKCFQLVKFRRIRPAFIQSTYECRSRGQRLASIKTRKQHEDVQHIFKNYFVIGVTMGYTLGWYFVPFAYSKFHKWSDNSLVYNLNHFRSYFQSNPSRIVMYGMLTNNRLKKIPFGIPVGYATLCEKELPMSTLPPQVIYNHLHSPQSTFISTLQCLTIGSDSHVTHTFMSCEGYRHCGNAHNSQFFALLNASGNSKMSPSVRIANQCTQGVFSCDDGIASVHHTFLCDFRQDCPDNSDESFCNHPSCDGFLCTNGQCVLNSQRCNEHSDCVDDSDEVGCQQHGMYSSCAYCSQARDVETKQFRINLDGTGYFNQQVMKADEPCPPSHYRCAAEWLYCLPLYTRCNGFSDCIHGEDEEDCDSRPCAGLYHCQTSRICVHGDHLCDGCGQCPQRDDELMCDLACPEGCLCQGHWFSCINIFPADQFLLLRYVDASGSGMLPSDFTANVYLIHLRLTSCLISNISDIQLSNLQHIDVSDNNVRSLDTDIFLGLSNLRAIQLARNPIRSNTVSKLTKQIHYILMYVDVSETNLDTLKAELYIYLPMMKYLNLSLCAVETIASLGFKNMPHLSEVDVRFNPVDEFPLDLLSGSDRLRKIVSSNYRFCCDNLLPRHSSKIQCSAPDAVFPSCTKLMPTTLYRTFFWVVSVCATLGNLTCFLSMFVVKGIVESNSLMTANLMIVKSCMGYHVSIVVVANELFHIHYIQFEKAWSSSLPCKVAGFLLYLSCETSVLIIGFTTMDHVIIICSGKDSWRLKKTPLTVACLSSWCVGILLSLIPFLPGLSHWGLRGQSGLCRLAIFDQYNADQEFRWFTVIVAVNSIICVPIAVSQIVIYRRTPKFRVSLDSVARSVYSSVHLMWKVAITNCVVWLSLGLVTVMAINKVHAVSKVHGAMVVSVLPIDSALNPFLFLWTLAMQRRQQAFEDKVVKVLKSRLVIVKKQKAVTQRMNKNEL